MRTIKTYSKRAPFYNAFVCSFLQRSVPLMGTRNQAFPFEPLLNVDLFAT